MKEHRICSAQAGSSTGILCDQTISLDGFYAKQDCPDNLRCVRFKDSETDKTLVFIIKHMAFQVATICVLYKIRWQVELFFKWIKQYLRIKRFFGTSENAVKTQFWIAVSVYVLVAIVKERLGNVHFSTDFVGHPLRLNAFTAGFFGRCLHFIAGGRVTIESIYEFVGWQ